MRLVDRRQSLRHRLDTGVAKQRCRFQRVYAYHDTIGKRAEFPPNPTVDDIGTNTVSIVVQQPIRTVYNQ